MAPLVSMSADRLKERIIAIIKEAVPSSFSRIPIQPSAHLRRDLGIDSLSLVSMVYRFEEELGVDLSEASVPLTEVRTVQDIIVVASELLGAPRT